jgi:hypothetical protein
MENEERDRPDGPGPETTPDDVDEALTPGPPAAPEPPVDEVSAPPADDATEAVAAAEEPQLEEPEPPVSAAEIESWPSQDAGSAAADAWPTEPPAAGSAPADAWPTEPPELGDEPILEPPPGEAEAHAAPPPYPTDGTASEAYASAPPVPAEPPPSDVEAYAGLPPLPAEPDEAPATPMTGDAQAAPAVEGATHESTMCPRCGTENQAGLSFCRNCGQRLVAAGVATTIERPAAPEGTMACPRCGTHNRAGVSFCQNCGANLRGAAPGYVPPAVAGETTAAAPAAVRGGAVLGPVVLLIGIVGLVTGYLLPFLFGTGSLFDRAFGAGGYGISFWSDYPDGGLAERAYFGLAAAVPILIVLLAILAIAGFVRARPGMLQTAGLVIALAWSVGLIIGFLVVELGGNWDGDLVGMLRLLQPGGIILFLASLIVVIGTLTRIGRS